MVMCEVVQSRKVKQSVILLHAITRLVVLGVQRMWMAAPQTSFHLNITCRRLGYQEMPGRVSRRLTLQQLVPAEHDGSGKDGIHANKA